jgi:general stress protein CsbA
VADPPGFTEIAVALALVLLAARIYFTNWISLFVMVTLGVCALRAVGLILASVTNTLSPLCGELP